MRHNMEAYSPALLYRNALFSSTDCDMVMPNASGSFLPKTNLYTTSMLGDGLSASHRYLTNEVANFSIDSGGNGTLWPMDVSALNLPQATPTIFKYCRGDRFSGAEGRPSMSQMPSSYKVPNESLNGGLCFTTNSVQESNGITTPDVYLDSHLYRNFRNPPVLNFGQIGQSTPSDMHTMADCQLYASGNFTSPASSFGSRGNFGNMNPSSIQCNLNMHPTEAHHQMYIQTNEEGPQVSESFVQLLLMDTQTPGSTLEHMLQSGRLNKEIQFSRKQPHQTYETFDQHQHWQEEQYQQQQQFFVENNMSSVPQSESFLNQPIKMNGYIPPVQVLRASRTGPGATWQPQALYGAAVGNELNKQYQLLLYTLWEHLKNCTAQEQECQFPCCATVKETLNHMSRLNDIHGCLKKRLFLHYSNCRKSDCVLCHPVRVELKPVIQGSHMAANLRSDTVERLAKRKRMEHSISHSCQSGISKVSLPLMDHTHLSPRGLFQVSQQASTCVTTRTETVTANLSSDTVERLTKCKKMEHSSISHSCQSGISKGSLPLMDHTHLSPRGLYEVSQQGSTCVTTGTETVAMEMKSCASSTPESFAKLLETTSEVPEVATKMDPDVEAVISNKIVAQCEHENMQVQMEADNVELEAECKTTVPSAAQVTGKKLGKPETKSVSLIDSFTPEQVREHIKSLMRSASQSKLNAAKKQLMEHLVDMNSCLLCGMAELSFKPLLRYCASCFKRICPKTAYYSMGSVDGDNSQKSFCGKCYNAPGESVNAAGFYILKAQLEMRNAAEDESWVECGKCKAWQHQICALFNGKMNEDGQAEYTCPKCFLQEIGSGKHELLPRSTVLGAKDLPKTMLSNHIEQRLFRRLIQERQERARRSGANFDEVPRAEDLVVRVVSSVDNKLPVKQLFYEIFQGEKYPTEFPYKSKAIMLFQKIEGADVCLFAMYVQEFGSDCAYPNRRHVCISYLDSVKYFQPEIKAVTGEALRTFVYHEILIGYLDYCKKRGFTTCYIWSCPPATQDNYILYCHPEIQKTPNRRKLREWYLAMIHKATKENIAVDCTNLYDLFFIHTDKCKTKVTAARLPYFDGDYWPGEAEKLLQQKDGNIAQKKKNKAAIERTVRAALRDTSEGNPKDILLMHELGGGVIRSRKEDFIMVRLQYDCSHCNQLIMSGRQWFCRFCRNFQLCEKCHDSKQNLNMKEKHLLCQVGVENMPLDIHDKDEIMQSDYFDTRMAFLNLCQQNYYQFDTLRRAKHSTMMILYHLHNPTAPTFRPPCTICHDVVEMAQGRHCVICPDFYLCGSCYQREGGVHHDHDLISLSTTDFDVLQNKLTPQKEQMVLDLLLHALKCCVGCCTYPYCQKLKILFRHNAGCTIRLRGGCKLCRKIWYVLTLHARACKEVECHVPRCKDLKKSMEEDAIAV